MNLLPEQQFTPEEVPVYDFSIEVPIVEAFSVFGIDQDLKTSLEEKAHQRKVRRHLRLTKPHIEVSSFEITRRPRAS